MLFEINRSDDKFQLVIGDTRPFGPNTFKFALSHCFTYMVAEDKLRIGRCEFSNEQTKLLTRLVLCGLITANGLLEHPSGTFDLCIKPSDIPTQLKTRFPKGSCMRIHFPGSELIIVAEYPNAELAVDSVFMYRWLASDSAWSMISPAYENGYGGFFLQLAKAYMQKINS